MELDSILEQHNKIKNRIMGIFQTTAEIKSYMDFDEMVITFQINPPLSDTIYGVAEKIPLTINKERAILFQGTGLFATQQIKQQIDSFVNELEKIVGDE